MRCLTLLLALIVPTIACSTPGGPDSGPSGVYGESPSLSEPLTVDELLADAGDNTGRTVLVTGTVDEVCPKKGCWMTLVSGDESMRVTFKDYGFFVPMDIAGRSVTFEGEFAVAMVPEKEARHYLEDAGRHEEAAAIEGPQESFTFVATGVRLHD